MKISSVLKLKLAVLLVLFCIIAAAINSQLGSMLEAAIQTQARQAFSSAVNEAVDELIDENGALCGNIINMTTNDSGGVSSLSTDTAALNSLNAALSLAVTEKLDKLEEQPLKLPLGTLTGLDILAGIGPDINVRIRLIGSALCDLSSCFIDAGVNQTLHTVSSSVSAQFYAIMPGSRTKIELCCDMILAQSVIVGEVPDSYTIVNGDESDTIGRIFDYGDPYGKDTN